MKIEKRERKIIFIFNENYQHVRTEIVSEGLHVPGAQRAFVLLSKIAELIEVKFFPLLKNILSQISAPEKKKV
jgi:hypothetical protein